MANIDPKYMDIAIELSKLGYGTTSPNPVVGCVIVKDGVVVGSGYHEYAGGPHAEVVALKQAKERARGADVYVTLEPCSFYGRTPPCVDALIKAEVKRVIAALKDPHPKVSGSGFEALRKAGIEVVEGVLKEKAAFYNRYYLTSILKNRPYVTLKLAATLDGYTADARGFSKWITSKKARDDVQELRRIHDAIAVGSSTFIADKPRLTYRGKKKKIPELKKFVLVSSKNSFKQALAQFNSSDVIFAVNQKLLEDGFDEYSDRFLPIKERNGLIDLQDFLNKLNEMQIRSLLVEGGARLAASFLTHGLFDELVIYYAPKILGSGKKLFEFERSLRLNEAYKLDFHSFELLGTDAKLTYFNPEVVFRVYRHS